MTPVIDSFKSFLGSLKFVMKYKLYVYFLPAIILAVLFYLSFKGGQTISGSMAFMEDWWLIGSIIEGMGNGIKALAFLTFEFVILVLLTPINSFFAEKVQEDLTGVKAKFDFKQFASSMFRAIRIFAIAFFTEIALLIVIWILSFFLGDNFYKIVTFVVSSFFIGFSFYDFGLELDGKNTRKSWQFAKENKLLCLIAGLIFSLAIYIPEESGLMLLFLVSISFVPHMLTIGSTQLYFEKYSQKVPN